LKLFYSTKTNTNKKSSSLCPKGIEGARKEEVREMIKKNEREERSIIKN
jgi:hypothetical protein